MKFDDRYSSAVRSSNLKSAPDTRMSDTDVLTAAGLSAARYPLAFALMRLLAGQNRGVAEVVEAMARMAFGKSKRLHLAIEWIDAEDMAKMVLAWYRHGRCNPCGGRGYQVIEGTARLGNQCPACHGSGKRNFDDEFALERIELARWLLCELEREIPKGASAAMSLLASELRF